MGADAAGRVASLVGPSVLTITDMGNGWPVRADLQVEDQTVPIDLFVSKVGSGQRPARLDIERRFQNSGQNKPIVVTPGRTPVLAGIWYEDDRIAVPRPVMVLADPHKRVDLVTRFSVFQDVATLLEAANTGWATRANSDGETILYFVPAMLPVAVEARGLELPDTIVQAVVQGSGLAEDPEDEDAGERARRSSSSIVRDAKFSKVVATAYDRKCAMCGIGVVIEGAHIYPASAPGSQDKVWNGFALCPNHHSAFDRHLIAVHPESMKISYHPDVMVVENLGAFMNVTFSHLKLPEKASDHPRPEMFEKRYAHYEGKYDWMS